MKIINYKPELHYTKEGEKYYQLKGIAGPNEADFYHLGNFEDFESSRVVAEELYNLGLPIDSETVFAHLNKK